RRLRAPRRRRLAPLAQYPGRAQVDDETGRGPPPSRRSRSRLGHAGLPSLRLWNGLLMGARQSRRLTLDLRVERFAYHQPFRIAGHVFTETALLVATLSDGEHKGRGEGAGVYYLGDDIAHMVADAS